LCIPDEKSMLGVKGSFYPAKYLKRKEKRGKIPQMAV